MIRHPPIFTLFPYTTLFRSVTIGFLQYLSPSISFILGLFVYHETFTRQHFITFLLIWIALVRSEEHTSELQSHSDLVCRLLLEKKKHAQHHQLHPMSVI